MTKSHRKWAGVAFLIPLYDIKCLPLSLSIKHPIKSWVFWTSFFYLSESSLTKLVENIAPTSEIFLCFFLEMVKGKNHTRAWYKAGGYQPEVKLLEECIPSRQKSALVILVCLQVSYLVHSLQGSWFPVSLPFQEKATLGPPCEWDVTLPQMVLSECPSCPQRQGHSKHFVFYTLSPASVRKYTLICSHPYFSCHMC